MMRKFNSHDGGFTLLEVLVALVVLSVGLLGLSGLQTTGLRSNHSAFVRSQATLVTNDIFDRMRANRNAATSGDYNIAYTSSPSGVNCVANCSATQIAQMDVGLWRAYVERLPEGEGSIAVDAAGLAEVEVCWSDQRGSAVACSDANSDKLKLVTRTQL